MYVTDFLSNKKIKKKRDFRTVLWDGTWYFKTEEKFVVDFDPKGSRISKISKRSLYIF